MAMGMGSVPTNYPILGAFRSKLFELGREGAAIKNKYKPMSEFHPDLDRIALLSWMFRRYGVSEASVLEVEEQIRGIKSLPWFLAHDVFARFARDY
jgi:hypothetical protein